jgi:hypothetical protein
MACQLGIDYPPGARAGKELCTRAHGKRETGTEIPRYIGIYVYINQGLIAYSGTLNRAIVAGRRASLRHASAPKESTGGRKDKRDQQIQILGEPSLAAARAQSVARRRHQAQGPVLRRSSDLPYEAILIERRAPIAPGGMQHLGHVYLRVQTSC